MEINPHKRRGDHHLGTHIIPDPSSSVKHKPLQNKNLCSLDVFLFFILLFWELCYCS